MDHLKRARIANLIGLALVMVLCVSVLLSETRVNWQVLLLLVGIGVLTALVGWVNRRTLMSDQEKAAIGEAMKNEEDGLGPFDGPRPA